MKKDMVVGYERVKEATKLLKPFLKPHTDRPDHELFFSCGWLFTNAELLLEGRKKNMSIYRVSVDEDEIVLELGDEGSDEIVKLAIPTDEVTNIVQDLLVAALPFFDAKTREELRNKL